MSKINFSKSKFYGSYGFAKDLPKSIKPELIFVGKSNVGKSSLLNKLCGNKKLAKVSSSPGKTTTINFFDLENCYFVDLPGYGYSNRCVGDQKRWLKLIENYFESIRFHTLILCLLDSRHVPTNLDIQMIEYLESLNLNYICVLTKSDKLSKQKLNKSIKEISKKLKIETSKIIPLSTTSGVGINKLKMYLENSI